MGPASYRLRSPHMTKNHFQIVAAALFALASSCSGCFGCVPPGTGDGGNVPSSCVTGAIMPEPQKLDVLFVIDDSKSMREEQEGVARELTGFIDELKKGGGVSQDFNIGVITTSVYQHLFSGGVEQNKGYPNQEGKLQPVPDGDIDGGVLHLGDGGIAVGTERVLNGNDPLLVSKFARLVQVGITGSGQETPFEAVRLALIDLDKVPLAMGGNGGFLRDGARLLVVIVTDEDDCSEKVRPSTVTVGENPLVDYCTEASNSLTPVSEYHRIFTEELRDSNGDTRPIIWTVIGPVARSNKAAMSVVETGQVRNIDCPTSNEPGFRHRMMAEKFNPTLLNLDSICRDSYRETLLLIAGLANILQEFEVRNVPNGRMLQVLVTRKDLTVQRCTLSDGLSRYCEANGACTAGSGTCTCTPGEARKVFFGPTCQRRADDTNVSIKMLCVN